MKPMFMDAIEGKTLYSLADLKMMLHPECRPKEKKPRTLRALSTVTLYFDRVKVQRRGKQFRISLKYGKKWYKFKAWSGLDVHRLPYGSEGGFIEMPGYLAHKIRNPEWHRQMQAA